MEKEIFKLEKITSNCAIVLIINSSIQVIIICLLILGMKRRKYWVNELIKQAMDFYEAKDGYGFQELEKRYKPAESGKVSIFFFFFLMKIGKNVKT